MSDVKEFKIPFVGLKPGLHFFHWTVGDSFFVHFPHSPVQKGSVSVNLEFEKKEGMFILKFDTLGQVQVECDRCSGNFSYNLEFGYIFYVRYKEDIEGKSPEDSEVIFISRTDTILDVSQLVYETVILGLPFHKVHPDDENGNSGCDPQIMKYLDRKDENDEKDEVIDERWLDLLKIKNKIS